jgi:hypothetical protein
MAEADSSQRAYQAGDTQSAGPTGELLDVLIRGLEMARRSGGEPETLPEGPAELFCTYFYAETGTLVCPLFYYHA